MTVSILSRMVYYSYSQIYQVSYTLPLYRAVGGTFLVRNIKKWIQFKKYMSNRSYSHKRWPSFTSPRVKIFDTRNKINKPLILLSPSVQRFHPDNNIVSIFTAHGSGDKRYYGPSITEKMEGFDYHFISGPKNVEKLKDLNVRLAPEKMIKIGNMRFDDYVNATKKDRERLLKYHGITQKDKLNILYAPTWQWGKGSLLKYAYRFCNDLSPHHNLIIRPHGHDRMKIQKLKRWVKQSGLKDIYFSNPSNLAKYDIMNDFLASDLLISDVTSSVPYEYLITGKPIILISNDFSETHQMPQSMKIQQLADIYDESIDILKLVDNSLSNIDSKKSDYKELLKKCFYYNDGKSVQRAINFLNTLKI